jgi:hypothetical protein
MQALGLRTQLPHRPLIGRPALPGRCAVAARAAALTADQAGDVAWTRTYYPKLMDTKKVEKDWCACSFVLPEERTCVA